MINRFFLLLASLLSLLLYSCDRSYETSYGNSKVIVIASEHLSKPDGNKYLFYKSPEGYTWRLIDAKQLNISITKGYEYTILAKPIIGSDFFHVVKILNKEYKKSSNIPKLTFDLKTLTAESDEIAFADRLNDADSVAPGIIRIDSLYVVDGDIVISEDQLADYLDVKSGYKKTHYWSNNTIYYTYAPGFTKASTASSAISTLESQTSLHFVYGANSNGYIEFCDGSSTYSTATGKTGNKQQIFLKPTCSSGSAMHEIGHAIGLIHEHRRPDRNAHVVVYDNNIIETEKPQFTLMSTNEAVCVGDFDLSSIMMYSSMAFSKNGNPTILTTEGAAFNSQRDSLSSGDLVGISAIYGPPYHRLESTRTITRNEVTGIYEYYEYYDTYTIRFYSNSDYTNNVMITTPRPISFYYEDYYYNTNINQFCTESYVYNVTIPAGCYSYNITTLYGCENYVMSDVSEYSMKSLSLF
jgi:hypothetical protein